MPRKKTVRREASQDSILKSRIAVAWKNFLIFLGLAVISFIMYTVSSGLFSNLFKILAIIFSFLTIALLIVLAVFLILRLMR